MDSGEKRDLYARVFNSREYFYYGADDPDLPGRYRDELVGLRLSASGSYETIEPDPRGLVWSEVLGAYIGRWDGFYEDGEKRWIRLYDSHGRLIPTGEETERRRADEVRRRADEERSQAGEERRQKEAALAEVARLRAQLESRG